MGTYVVYVCEVIVRQCMHTFMIFGKLACAHLKVVMQVQCALQLHLCMFKGRRTWRLWIFWKF